MIQMNGFANEPAELVDAMESAAAQVIRSHHFVLGPNVDAFEAAWASAAGSPHAVGVGNGLDAIEIALRASGIGSGDEVITTPMTAIATVLGILRAGAAPVLADIDPQTALLDLSSVERCITPRTRAIMPVHLYGQVRGMAALAALAAEHGLIVIEDCAQGHLAVEDGVPAGGYGLAAAWSFYPTKNLGAIGDAGALTTADSTIAATARRLRNYGQRNRYEHVDQGLNSRLDEMQAALLLARLPWLSAFTARRREVAATYRAGIREGAVRLLAEPVRPESHVHHLFVVTAEDREALAAHLAERGVQTLVHYPIPAHRQPALAGILTDPTGLPAAERHANTCLSLPCHPQLSDDDVAAVIDAVNAYNA